MELLKAKLPLFNKILLAAFIFSLFFSVRHVFFSNDAYLTGAYSDFTSFSLYLSDILLFLLVIFNAKSIFTKKTSIVLLSIVLLLFIEVLLRQEFQSLGVYFSFKFFEFALAFCLFRTKKISADFKNLIPLFVVFGAIQGLIALVQFTIQGSIGLPILGESQIGPNILNVAKVVARGAKYIRGYGTFPHSNLLAAFLVTGIILNIYLLYKSSNKLTKLCYSITLFIQNLGLVIALSRIGFLALALSGAVWFGILVAKAGISKRTTWIFGALVICMGVAIALFYPYLLPRATISDQAAKERWFYNRVGIDMILDKPYFGSGPGTSVIHMEQYSPSPLEPWQKQPIHNYYLLVIAEFGLFISIFVIGAIVFLILKIGKIVLTLSPSQPDWVYKLTLFSIGIGYMLLMAFDHYFYTIQQTQLLFWLIIGLIAGVITKNSSSKKLPDID
jgi:hypothetical protein